MNNRVKQRREELGLSQEELADKSKVSRQTISDLENNKLDNVGSKILKKLAAALECEVTDIFFNQTVVCAIQESEEE